jgi:Cu-processing system ATP-binding protein
VIELRGVAKRFGATQAVAGLDLRVREGELFGLIGHNGAGKTTLFKMMLGLVEADAGEIRIGGELVGGAAFRAVRRTIGYLPESAALYDNLNGRETLAFFARLKGADAKTIPALLERVGLGAAGERAVRGYSKGMRQRLAFAQALLGSPRLLFLDEPTNGLDPQGIRDFYQVLRELREQGVTAILTSHILAEIQQRVDRLALMHSGRVQALGSVAALREALHMPLSIRASLRGGSAAPVRRALEAAAAAEAASVRIEGEELSVACTRERKLAVLGALLAADVADIQVVEPTLEDVFLGYADLAA